MFGHWIGGLGVGVLVSIVWMLGLVYVLIVGVDVPGFLGLVVWVFVGCVG